MLLSQNGGVTVNEKRLSYQNANLLTSANNCHDKVSNLNTRMTGEGQGFS